MTASSTVRVAFALALPAPHSAPAVASAARTSRAPPLAAAKRLRPRPETAELGARHALAVHGRGLAEQRRSCWRASAAAEDEGGGESDASDLGAGGGSAEAFGEPDAIEYFDLSHDPISESDSAPDTVPAFGSFDELPLFPLPLVLNPGSSIPLHVFEMRYRLMFNRIRDTDSRFGIVFYDKQKDAIASVGCSAELLRFEPLPDGRIMTNNIGRDRFRIVTILEEKPYKRALVEYFRDEKPENGEVAELAKLEEQVWTALLDVLRLSNKLYDKALDLGSSLKELAPTEKSASSGNEEASPEESSASVGVETGNSESAGPPSSDLDRTQDFSFAVSQVLDMPLSEQQMLLQTRKTSRRLRKQSKMLDTARQYLAAQVVIKEAGLKF